jgi:hypothetical protein
MTKAELLRALEPFDDTIQIETEPSLFLVRGPARHLRYEIDENGKGSIVISGRKQEAAPR